MYADQNNRQTIHLELSHLNTIFGVNITCFYTFDSKASY